MFKESSFYLEDLLSEIEKAEMSLSPSLSGSCLSTVPPFPRTKAFNSTCPEEAGRAMLSYECPGRCGQKTKFFSRADTVHWAPSLHCCIESTVPCKVQGRGFYRRACVRL